VAIVIDSHIALAERHGLDGVHLPDGARNVRAARKTLGADAIVGSFCGASRHDGMNAGEAGADYVAFGPVAGAGLGDGTLAERDLFAWWSEMIEVPVVAEGGFSPEVVETLAPVADFIALGEEIWRADDPLEALRRHLARFG
jgi:thiamine-phosphate pyrophosphorylase